MGDCVLVVTTWGNPLLWRDAVYVSEGVYVDSCCSVVALLKVLVSRFDLEGVKRISLLGLDSVVDVSRERLDRFRGLCGDSFKECYKEYYEKRYGDRVPGSYGDVVNVATSLYKCVYERVLENSYCSQDACHGKARCFDENTASRILSKTSVVVLPATGSPGGKWVFEGCPEDYLAGALLNVVPEALSVLRCCSGSVKLVFDATHGINYTPALTFRLVWLLAQLIRLRYGVDVEVEVYNSDPYPADFPLDKKPELNVNKVFDARVTEVDIPYVSASFKILSTCKTLGEQSIEQSSGYQSKHLPLVVRNVVSSVYSPAPLALLYSCFGYFTSFKSAGDVVGELERSVRAAYSSWINSVHVSSVDKLIKVKRKLVINSTAIWALLFTSAICHYVDELAGKHGTRVYTDRISPFNLGMLEELNDRVYGRVFSTMKYIVDQELSLIKLYAKTLREQGFTKGCYPYHSTRDQRVSIVQPKPEGERRQTTERVVIAHAALPYDYVDVCIEDGSLLVKYRDEDALKKILEKLKNVYDERGGSSGKTT